MKKFILIIIAFLIIIIGCYCIFTKNKSLKIDHIVIASTYNSDNTASYIIETMFKYIIEKKYKIPVRTIKIDYSNLWSGLRNQKIDICSYYLSNNKKEYFLSFAENTITPKAIVENLLEGFFIPLRTSKSYNIKTMYDLKGKEKIFDINNNGIGDVWVGQHNWPVSKVNIKQIESYNLNMEPLDFQQWICYELLYNIQKNNSKPIVFYNWEPEWPTNKLNFINLKGHENNPYNSDDQLMKKNDAYMFISNALKYKHPNIFKTISNFYILKQDLKQLIREIEDINGIPIIQSNSIIKKWVDKNLTYFEK